VTESTDRIFVSVREIPDIDTASIRVRLIPVYGISIACIIRKGESNTRISISDIQYENAGDSACYLNMKFNRNGNMSTYGDVLIHYTDQRNKSYEVGKVQGFAVYNPGAVRRCKIELQKPEGVNFREGKFTVTYTGYENSKSVELAEAEVFLNKIHEANNNDN
jgi:hypothetical protein